MQCAFLSCENTLWRSTCDAQRTPTAVAADGVKIGNLEHVDSVYIYIAKLIFDSAYLFVPYVYIYTLLGNLLVPLENPWDDASV